MAIKRREVEQFVAELGGIVTELIDSRHWKVQADFSGVPLQFSISKTPSDWRADRNKRTEIRNRLREAQAARQ